MSTQDRQNWKGEHSGREHSPDYFLYLMTPVQGRIYAYIMSRWPNKADADDIMQETISILWKKFDTYELGTEFLPWAFAVAKYVLLNFRKKHRQNPIQFSEEALAALETQSQKVLKEYSNQIDILRECIDKLPSKETNLLKLKYEEGLSSQKIATRFGMPLRTFYRVVSRIHSALMRCMNLSTVGDKL